MSMLVPPQMLNTMAPMSAPADPGFTEAFYADPVRRYMIPVFTDRRADWPSHPYAQRDSLHEAEMWAVEGLTHRYPNQGAGRAAAHLPAVLRALHPDGPGRQPDPGDRQAQVRAGRRGPARIYAGLPAAQPGSARRRGLRRGRGQPALAAARVVRGRAAPDRLDQGHQAGQQGADGPAAALAVG